VVPVLQPLSEATEQAVYFPVGTWFNFWSKERQGSTVEWRNIVVIALAGKGGRGRDNSLDAEVVTGA
jgi:hypothetical protein